MVMRRLLKGYDLKELIERVAGVTGITSDDIIRSGRRRKTSCARDLLCYWATEYLNVRQRELSDLFIKSAPLVFL